jgi:hypothetical protein
VAARLGLPTPEGIEGLAASGSPLLYAPAIALALRGTAHAATRMNFRQDEFALRLDLVRQLRDFRPTLWLAGVAALLAVVSFGTSTLLESRRASAIEAEAARLWTEAFPSKPAPPNLLAAMRDEVGSAKERAEFLGVYAGNLSALDLLTEISKRVPADLDVVFEELAIDKQMIGCARAKAWRPIGSACPRHSRPRRARIGSIETDNKGAKRFTVTIALAPEAGTNDSRGPAPDGLPGPRRAGAAGRLGGGMLGFALLWLSLVMPLLAASDRVTARATPPSGSSRTAAPRRRGRRLTTSSSASTAPRAGTCARRSNRWPAPPHKVESMEPRTTPANDRYRETKVGRAREIACRRP